MAAQPSDPVTRFTGPYFFLSNFAQTPFSMPGMDHLAWPTAEHCYQAAKSPTMAGMEAIRNAPGAAEAKAMGRAMPLHPDWDKVKKTVMMQIVMAKFSRNPELLAQLCATRGRYLIEGNTWGDHFWGCVPAETRPQMIMPLWDPEKKWAGHNWLGRILMMARDVMDPLP